MNGIDEEVPTANMTLLRKVTKWARAQAAKPPETCAWDQNSWRSKSAHNCHTTFCIAGYAVEAAGGRWASDDPSSGMYDRLLVEPEDSVFEQSQVHGLATVSVPYRARRLLGLTHAEASLLFEGHTEGIDRVMVDVKRVAKRAGKRLL